MFYLPFFFLSLYSHWGGNIGVMEKKQHCRVIFVLQLVLVIGPWPCWSNTLKGLGINIGPVIFSVYLLCIRWIIPHSKGCVVEEARYVSSEFNLTVQHLQHASSTVAPNRPMPCEKILVGENYVEAHRSYVCMYQLDM